MLHAEIHAWVGWLDHREVFNLHDDLLIPRRIWMDPLCQCGFFTVCLYSGPTARNTETVPHSGRRVYFPANGDRHCRSAELGQRLCDRSAHGSFCSRWENDGSCCLCDNHGMVFRAEQGSWQRQKCCSPIPVFHFALVHYIMTSLSDFQNRSFKVGKQASITCLLEQ